MIPLFFHRNRKASGHRPWTHKLALAATMLLTSALAHAQVTIGGSLSDSTTGPLVSGTIYHMTSSVTVPAGEQLTIQPDVIIKAAISTQIIVNGTLSANGTPAQPITITSLADDSAGGDTNGDGASSGSPGDWFGLRFFDPGSSLSWTTVRYAGRSSFDAIFLSDADIVLSNCTVRDSLADGLNMTDSSRGSTVTGCSFQNSGIAVKNVPLRAVPGFSGNTASGNSGNYMEVSSYDNAADVTISLDDSLGGVLYFDAGLTIDAGRRVTLPAGLVVKNRISTQWIVNGELVSQGTQEQPVVLTSFADDDHGGDTNGDGPSSGSPGDWFSLRLFGSDSDLQWTTVRYAGRSNFDAIFLGNSVVSLEDCTIVDCLADGINMGNGAVGTEIRRCTIENCRTAITNVQLEALPFLADNAALGNEGNYVEISGFSHTSDLVVPLEACIGNVLYFDASLTIQAGLRLTLPAGLVIKFRQSSQLIVNGELHANGTEAQPIVFTSFTDDEYGGDTNGDGVSSGVPGEWFALRFFGAGSELRSVVVRYAGRSNFDAIFLSNAPIILEDSTIQSCLADALSLTSSTFGSSIQRCRFEENGGVAVSNVHLGAVPDFVDNSAQGNAGGNYMGIDSTALSGDTTIGPENILEGALVVQTSITVPSGITLTLLGGTNFKMGLSTQFTINGRLDCLGSRSRPIVITSYYDDEVAGDTDLGAGDATPGDWFRLLIGPTADPCLLSNLVVRYAGRSNFDAIDIDSELAQLELVRVDHALADGIVLSTADGSAERLVAWSCGGIGIHLQGGSFELRQATSVANARGIVRGAGYSGQVRDCISWNNSIANYWDFSVGDLTHSNGSPGNAGMLGNINSPPRFVDVAAGDLHLRRASPCIDAGDPLSPLDPDLTPADMGAYYFDHCAPRRICVSKPSAIGCVAQIDWSGYPSVALEADDFHITATSVPGETQGQFIWSLAANPDSGGIGLGPRSPTPFGVGSCLRAAVRGDIQSSGGTAGSCSGTFDFHFSQGLMASEGLFAGTTVYAQYLYADPGQADGSAMAHTDAISFMLCP